MPSTEIFVLLSIALAVWFWVDTLKARETGIAAVSDEHYEGGHWLGSFATYLVTGRGLEAPALREE